MTPSSDTIIEYQNNDDSGIKGKSFQVYRAESKMKSITSINEDNQYDSGSFDSGILFESDYKILEISHYERNISAMITNENDLCGDS
ncbi:unnamed protein product [Rotaria sp. Silwood1]|nr:unnamed protein product [Rotaria sp. Silwood1]